MPNKPTDNYTLGSRSIVRSEELTAGKFLSAFPTISAKASTY